MTDIRFFYALSIFILFQSCSNKNDSISNVYIEIEGKIDSLLILKHPFQLDTFYVDSSNQHFNFTPTKNTFFFNVQHSNGNIHFFAKLGDSISIKLLNQDSIVFSGSHAKENNALFHIMKQQKNLYTNQYHTIHTLELPLFLKKIEEIKTTQIKSISITEQLDVDFTRLCKQWVETQFVRQYFMHPYYFESFTGGKKPVLPSNYLENKIITQFDKNNADLLCFEVYTNLVSIMLSLDPNNSKEYGTHRYLWNYLYNIEKELLDSNIKSLITQDAFIYELAFNGLKHMNDSALQFYYTHCKNRSLNTQFELELNRWKNLQPGKKAPAAFFIDINNEQVSLDQFNGKNTYISIWASWCHPCKAQRKYLQKLVKKYDSKIQFLYISVDENKNHAQWITSCDTLSQYGINLRTVNGWNSKLTQNYNVRSIPRFITLNQFGNIVNANAPAPSEINEDFLMLF